MPKYTFGEPISDDDILVVQGVEYPMIPMGMRAMRRLLTAQQQIAKNRKPDDPITDDELNLAMDIVVNSVRSEHRDALREHIEESVPPNLLVQIATAVMGAFADVDPTQPESPSGGSSQTGPASTAGAPLAAPTLNT